MLLYFKRPLNHRISSPKISTCNPHIPGLRKCETRLNPLRYNEMGLAGAMIQTTTTQPQSVSSYRSLVKCTGLYLREVDFHDLL